MLCRVSKGARQALTAAKPAAVVTGRVGERIAGVGERLRGMMSWCTITVLDLSWFHLMHECESLAGVLRQCSSWLAHLDLSYNRRGAQRSYNRIGAERAGRLARGVGQCSSLAHLNLSDNDIFAEGAGRLAEVLGQCSSLAHLDLSSNGIGAEGRGRLAMPIASLTISFWPQQMAGIPPWGRN